MDEAEEAEARAALARLREMNWGRGFGPPLSDREWRLAMLMAERERHLRRLGLRMPVPLSA